MPLDFLMYQRLREGRGSTRRFSSPADYRRNYSKLFPSLLINHSSSLDVRILNNLELFSDIRRDKLKIKLL